MQFTGPRMEIVTATPVPAGFLEELAACAERLAANLMPTQSAGLKLMDDGEIRSLNRQFRGIDHATDVLSFPANGAQDGDRSAYAGDIALSWDAVQRQSEANGNSLLAEAAALVAHALLHLIGYDHDTVKAQLRMDELTRGACRAAGIEVIQFGH